MVSCEFGVKSVTIHFAISYNIGGNNVWTHIDMVKLGYILLDEKFAKQKDNADRLPGAPQNSLQRGESFETGIRSP